MSKPLNIAVLGCGFMGRTHSNAYSQVNHFFDREHQPVLKACYGREEDRAKLEAFAKTWGYESIETDWQKLIQRDDIDVIDCCAPNFMHRDIVVAAAEAGKMIVCEKPLAMNVAEAEEMVAAVEKAGVANMVSFNYRPRAGHRPVQADYRRGSRRSPVPLSGYLQPRLHDRLERTPGRHGPLAARLQSGRLRRDR